MAGGWARLYRKLIDDATENNTPISGFFELTSRCNLHCKMCYICSQQGDRSIAERELSAEQWISLGKEARENGLLFLTLTGGEIFIRNDFWDIYDAFSEMGFSLTLFTNASLLNSEKVKRLGAKPPSKVSITLYGARPETYGRVTGHPEALRNTLQAVRMLIDEGIKPELKTTIIKYNSHEFEEMAEIADSMGIIINIVNYVSPRREGSGTTPEEMRLSPADLIAFEKRVMALNEKLALRQKKEEDTVQLDKDIMINSEIDAHNSGAFKEAMQHSAFKCIAGKCGFWVSWDGRLMPCGILNEPYTEPLKIGFGKAWEQLRQACLTVPECKDCASCSYKQKCMACPGRLLSETGSFEKPAEYLCQMAKERFINNVKY